MCSLFTHNFFSTWRLADCNLLPIVSFVNGRINVHSGQTPPVGLVQGMPLKFSVFILFFCTFTSFFKEKKGEFSIVKKETILARSSKLLFLAFVIRHIELEIQIYGLQLSWFACSVLFFLFSFCFFLGSCAGRLWLRPFACGSCWGVRAT